MPHLLKQLTARAACAQRLGIGATVPLAAAYWVGYVIWTLGGIPGVPRSTLASNLVFLPISLANVLLTWSVGTRGHGAPAAARACAL